MEIVFFLQLGGNLLAAPKKKVLIEPLALLVDINGHYMDMVPVDVLVLVNYERLLPEAKFLQILAGEDFKILIRELIIRVRIERDMKDRLFCPPHHRHELSEIFGNTTDVDLPVCRKNDFVGSQQTAFLLVDFLGIICQCTVERRAYRDFCDHCSSNFSDRAMTSVITAIMSIVAFSSL